MDSGEVDLTGLNLVDNFLFLVLGLSGILLITLFLLKIIDLVFRF